MRPHHLSCLLRPLGLSLSLEADTALVPVLAGLEASVTHPAQTAHQSDSHSESESCNSHRYYSHYAFVILVQSLWSGGKL